MASLKRKANRRKKIVKRIMERHGMTYSDKPYAPKIDIEAINRAMEKMSEETAKLDWWMLENPLHRMMRQPMKIVDPNSTSTMKGKGYDCY